MTRYGYKVRDRKGGELLYEDWIDATNRTEARNEILRVARRDTPGGRGRSPRDYGYVPVSDLRITFTHEDGIRIIQ